MVDVARHKRRRRQRDPGRYCVGENGYDVAFPTERHGSSSLLTGNINAESWVLSSIPEVTEQVSYNKAV
jgi:hypothetical protein